MLGHGTRGQGELAVVQAKPLPPFERWNFGEQRYMQFLQDQVCIQTMPMAGLGRFVFFKLGLFSKIPTQTSNSTWKSLLMQRILISRFGMYVRFDCSLIRGSVCMLSSL